MVKEDKYYMLEYYDYGLDKWLNIRFEIGELAKIKQFISKRNIKQYKLNIVEIKLHGLELGSDI